jgi:hypothetical protein
MYQAGSNKGGVGEKIIEDERGGLVRWYTLTETWSMYTIGIPYVGTPQFFHIRAPYWQKSEFDLELEGRFSAGDNGLPVARAPYHHSPRVTWDKRSCMYGLVHVGVAYDVTECVSVFG